MNTLHGFGSYPDLGDDEHYTLAKVYRDAARVCGHNADIDGFLQCMSSGPDKGAFLACLLRFCARWLLQLSHSRMAASDFLVVLCCAPWRPSRRYYIMCTPLSRVCAAQGGATPARVARPALESA